jgi:hypothetical protein
LSGIRSAHPVNRDKHPLLPHFFFENRQKAPGHRSTAIPKASPSPSGIEGRHPGHEARKRPEDLPEPSEDLPEPSEDRSGERATRIPKPPGSARIPSHMSPQRDLHDSAALPTGLRELSGSAARPSDMSPGPLPHDSAARPTWIRSASYIDLERFFSRPQATLAWDPGSYPGSIRSLQRSCSSVIDIAPQPDLHESAARLTSTSSASYIDLEPFRIAK